MSALTVLHVNTELTWRGGEAQTLMLARGLEQRGHRFVEVQLPFLERSVRENRRVEVAVQFGMGCERIRARSLLGGTDCKRGG